MRRSWTAGACALTLLVGATCNSWEDETKGTAPAASTTPTAVGTGGGGAGCLSCFDFLMASFTCSGAACPVVSDVCEGSSREALDALLDCALCTACAAECVDSCGAGGGGTLEVSEGCRTCLMGATQGACASEYGTCEQS